MRWVWVGWVFFLAVAAMVALSPGATPGESAQGRGQSYQVEGQHSDLAIGMTIMGVGFAAGVAMLKWGPPKKNGSLGDIMKREEHRSDLETVHRRIDKMQGQVVSKDFCGATREAMMAEIGHLRQDVAAVSSQVGQLVEHLIK